MAINDTLELTVQGTVASTQHIHSLHFRSIGVLAADVLITEWMASCATTYRALFVTNDSPCQLLRAEVVCGAEPLPAAVEFVPAAGTQLGTRTASAGERSPAFVAALVTERTALAGRSRMGRFFIGGLTDGSFDLNDLAASYLTLVNAYIAALLAQFVTPSTPSFRQVVHSRKLAAVPGTQCQDSSAAVTAMIPSTRPTTMRSRKLGHGL